MAARAAPGARRSRNLLRPLSRAAAPPPVRAARRGAAGVRARADIVANQVAAKHGVAPVEVVAAPNPSTRWRIGAAGSIERSGNGGATWTASPSGVTEDLTAGAAPAPTVCWVVGRRGTVLLSVDGLQWRCVAFPTNTDLAAVQASDASSATVDDSPTTAASALPMAAADLDPAARISGAAPFKGQRRRDGISRA
mgnify:CR=1 FL=1